MYISSYPHLLYEYGTIHGQDAVRGGLVINECDFIYVTNEISLRSPTSNADYNAIIIMKNVNSVQEYSFDVLNTELLTLKETKLALKHTCVFNL
jgi:hypothetical protein